MEEELIESFKKMATINDNEDKEEDVSSDEEDNKAPAKENKMEEEKESFKAKIMKILDDNDMLTIRTKKLSVEDFLKLLSIFNKHDIHFK